jgi:hypothetical protein
MTQDKLAGGILLPLLPVELGPTGLSRQQLSNLQATPAPKVPSL